MNFICRLWPGLPGLLQHGRWPFLWIALSFFLLLDSFLILNFYWTHYLSTSGRWGAFLLLLFAWIILGSVAAGLGKHIERTLANDSKSTQFLEAIRLYLQANWFEAECLLNELLQKNPRDAEARLLLASLYRHTRRFPDALDTLRNMQRYEESGFWILEIEAEKRLIAKSLKEAEESEKEDKPEAKFEDQDDSAQESNEEFIPEQSEEIESAEETDDELDSVDEIEPENLDSDVDESETTPVKENFTAGEDEREN